MNPVERKIVVATPKMLGLAIDKALLLAQLKFSRRKIRLLLDGGRVMVNGRVERFANYKVKRGDKFSLLLNHEPPAKKIEAAIGIDKSAILFDQEGIIALNKPAHLSSQASRSPAVPHVVPIVEAYLRTLGDNATLMLCHRLDKETSGVLLLARSAEAGRALMAQFKQRSVEKTYLALCYGVPTKERWEVKCHLSTLDPKSGRVHKVHAGGLQSYTQFNTLAVNPKLKLSLIACFPHTGRTHQIRVHLELSELPIVGDKKYGSSRPSLPPALEALAHSRHYLHAEKLSFTLPGTGKKVTVQAPLPKDIKRATRLTLFKR